MKGQTVVLLAAELAAGRTTSRKLTEQALARIADKGGEGRRAVLKVYSAAALAEADLSDRLRQQGIVRSAVDGLPVTVKDLFDVAGDVTHAGSKGVVDGPPARSDALAVARLRAAGAIIIGRTAMVEFAFGGLGLNPHYGTPLNPFDRATGRVPGGSSSGAGVAVADGMCTMALGTDTRGSVRIPAALCGVAGFKPTASRVPRDGVFPLSVSLDSVGPLAPSVVCCAIYDSIIAGEAASTSAAPEPLPVLALRLAIPRCSLFDDVQPQVLAAFDRAVRTLKAAGAQVVELDAPLLTKAQELFKNGGCAGPESFQVHRHMLAERSALYDPRVASRIAMGEFVSAADYIQLGIDRASLMADAHELLIAFDAMIYPTVPAVAPKVADVDESDEAYVRWNLLMLRNTGLVNMLDGCAATIPCHVEGEPPVGLSVVGLRGTDKHVLATARTIEETLFALRSRI